VKASWKTSERKCKVENKKEQEKSMCRMKVGIVGKKQRMTRQGLTGSVRRGRKATVMTHDEQSKTL